MLEAVRTVESADLGSYRSAWDDLVHAQPLVSPFLCSWWLEAATVGDATPCYVLVVADGDLIGGIALQRDRLIATTRYAMRHQGVLCPDHLDLVARPGAESTVTEAIGSWLDAPGARLLDLDGLRDGSHVGALLGAQGATSVAPYHPLAGDYLAGRSATLRRSVRRGRTALAREGIAHRHVPEDDLADAWADFRRLHGTRAGRAALLGEVATLEQAVAGAYQRGEARLDTMSGPSGTVAVSVAFVVAGRLSLYQLARSLAPEHASAGTVLLEAVISDAAEHGATEVDFLRGDEGYKARFADERRPLGSARVGSGHGRATAAALDTKVAVRRTLGRGLRAARGLRSAEG